MLFAKVSTGFCAPRWLSAAGSAVEVDVNPTLVAVQLGLLFLAFVVLKPMLFDPILALYDEREKRSKGARRDAAAMDEKAAQLLRSYERELEQVRQSAAEQRERMRAEAHAVETKMLAETRAEVAVKFEAGRRALAEETHQTEVQLAASVDDLARRMAARALGREVMS